MKKLTAIVIIYLSLSLISYAQTKQPLNLDFEQTEKGYPTNWGNHGSEDYKVYADSAHAKNGRFSAVIENNGDVSNYKALVISLPDNYNGRSIRLTGYIKTENVTDGYAGIWMRIDPQVAFDNMQDRGVTGTTDWKEYEIILPLNPEKTEKIVIGGLLVGKGKMWLDNLQVSENVVFPDLNDDIIINLELLGKIWGFLKYHHPEVGKGNYNWDNELFRILPTYLDAENNQVRDNVLIDWINKYGKIPLCEDCKPTPGDAVLKPELSWIDGSNLSNDLIRKLKEIYNNRHQGEHYYIALHRNIGNPDFTNENAYSNMPYPDIDFRLLSLFRYWNMIEYFFPNKHLTDKKWDKVLKEYIPKFVNAKDELEYEFAAVQLIGEINDTHANLWGGHDEISKWRGNNFAPFRVEFVENKLVVTDYYNPKFSENATLKIGDVITHIQGKSIESIVDSLKPYYPSSNEASRLRDISADLLRSTKNTINLKYTTEGASRHQEITLYEKEKLNIYHWYKVDQDERSFKILNGNIGYVTLANIKQQDIPEIKESFENTKGVIIDIRNYPSTLVPFELGSYFFSKPTPFVKFTLGNPDHPGEFIFTNPVVIPSDGNNYKGKLVVLVNENSQSQAEYTAMAFRAVENSTVIGSTTAGADGNVSSIVLPGGLRTMISGIGVYYPDGTETQRVGIVPDILIRPTIDGIKNGKDEVLEKAIEIISQ